MPGGPLGFMRLIRSGSFKAAGGSPVFHAAGFDILVPKFSTLGLKLFDVLSLANTWQAFRVQYILSFRYTDIH